MDDFYVASLVALWGLVLVNLGMLIRVMVWIRQRNAERLRYVKQQRDELPIGEPAPDFRAKSIDGRLVSSDDFRGRRVAFVFVSPLCNECGKAIPDVQQLAPKAKEADGVEFVLVSDMEVMETTSWLDLLESRDGVTVELPVLVVAAAQSSFVETYNPSGGTPAFVLVDEFGVVRARSLLVAPEWVEWRRNWEGYRRLAPWMGS
ncbi:MAG: redoxin domain-containing protein [Ilumatobacter sp.]|uniref:peroxiredoxin family protein n=1 Tax=Ilumatobacter sp. TaxID=1967498 RepID=UPI0026069FE6|nr:redoxin domain-containing protein [Ilumatobacter sp.]MDJ0771212.1 redoxin domain-containing protein [Ilumatobacter sp.]